MRYTSYPAETYLPRSLFLCTQNKWRFNRFAQNDINSGPVITLVSVRRHFPGSAHDDPSKTPQRYPPVAPRSPPPLPLPPLAPCPRSPSPFALSPPIPVLRTSLLAPCPAACLSPYLPAATPAPWPRAIRAAPPASRPSLQTSRPCIPLAHSPSALPQRSSALRSLPCRLPLTIASGCHSCPLCPCPSLRAPASRPSPHASRS